MSSGLVVCSKCHREVHQGDISQMLPFGWYHCEDGSQRCLGADSIYPKDKQQVVGKSCGKDEWQWLPAHQLDFRIIGKRVQFKVHKKKTRKERDHAK